MFWYVMILLLLLYPAAITIMGEKQRINYDSITIFISSCIIVFFMAFRAVSIGADTKQYCYGFNQIKQLSFMELFITPIYGLGGNYELNFEYGYRAWNWLTSFFSQNQQIITIANSILIVVLLAKLIKKQSPYPFLSMWLYITLGIFQTQMNMARNAIAILICYHALQYIKEQKLTKYVMFVFFATMFHESSILFFAVYFLVNYVPIRRHRIMKLLIGAVIIGFIFSEVRLYVYDIMPNRYAGYITGNTTKFESLIVGVFYSGLMGVILFGMNSGSRLTVVENESVGMWMFIINIMFFCIGYDMSAATRIAALFGPYMIISIPRLINQGYSQGDKQRVLFLIFFLCGIQYLLRLRINNIGGTMPYEFIWNG